MQQDPNLRCQGLAAQLPMANGFCRTLLLGVGKAHCQESPEPACALPLSEACQHALPKRHSPSALYTLLQGVSMT